MTRRRIPADYPSKRHLSESDALNELKFGPDPAWFEPAYQRAVVIGHSGGPQVTYGLVRVIGDTEPFTFDVQLFSDREALSWALGGQWAGYSRHRDEPGARYDVLFFELDEPLRLRMVVELDDEDEAEPEVAK